MTNRSSKLRATYRITTPMFCSGTEPKLAELRLASFKGALRFWWRSLMHGVVRNVSDLHEKEASIFGAADDHGQSKIRMRIVANETKLDSQVNKGQQLGGGRLKGANYFGYGVLDAFGSKPKGTKPGELTRPMIPGGQFTVELLISPAIDEATAKSVRDAMVLIGTCGSMGSKARKGYGSITLTKLDGGELQSTPASLLGNVIKSHAGTPGWTAWSHNSRVIVVDAKNINDPLDLLDSVGCEQIHFRSWGKDGVVLGASREGNFARDHDMKNHPSQHPTPPDRIAFGLPHSYREGDVKPATKGRDRRASPLFIHIHQTSAEAQPSAVISFLPSLFLPVGEKIKAFNETKDFSRGEDFWYPIHAFLDRLVGDGSKPSARPGYEKFPAESTWWEKKKTNLQGKEVKLGNAK